MVQRRLYWLLDPSSSLVLVHYLQLPDATIDQRLPPPPGLPRATDRPKLLMPSLDRNEVPSVGMLALSKPKAAGIGWTGIRATTPEVVICGTEFTLMMVLAAPIHTDESSDGPLLCVLGRDKVIIPPPRHAPWHVAPPALTSRAYDGTRAET
jgi:hypothetical protein